MTQAGIRLDAEVLRTHARPVDEAADGAAYPDLHDEVCGQWPGKLPVSPSSAAVSSEGC